VVAGLAARKLKIAVAESCTGGLIGHLLTCVPGSSAVLDLAVVAYGNGMKVRVLGVSQETLAGDGAVSETAVRQMAEGVRRLAGADLGVATSGIAGPDGGSSEKPVGTVWFGLASAQGVLSEMRRFAGDRLEIKLQSARHALEMVRRHSDSENR
jgi:nicotinamide-nucleotide amidase